MSLFSRERRCDKCKYVWLAKLTHPKSCPRCKTRLDYKRSN